MICDKEMYDYEKHDVYTTLYLRYMIVMLERNAVLPTIAGNYGLCQMVPICSKCWVVLFAFLVKHCQCTNHHTKPLTDMGCSRLWENTQTNTLHVTNVLHSRPPCDKPLVCSHSKAGQNKPVLAKKNTCKRVRYITSIIWFYIHLDFPWLHPEQQRRTKYFLQWDLCYQQDWIILDPLNWHCYRPPGFPHVHRCFFCEMAKTVNFTISIYIT